MAAEIEKISASQPDLPSDDNGEEPPVHEPSALDLNCKAHDLDNLYVVDASFFVSIAAVNPSLTIIANVMRVGDHLLKRLG